MEVGNVWPAGVSVDIIYIIRRVKKWTALKWRMEITFDISSIRARRFFANFDNHRWPRIVCVPF